MGSRVLNEKVLHESGGVIVGFLGTAVLICALVFLTLGLQESSYRNMVFRHDLREIVKDVASRHETFSCIENAFPCVDQKYRAVSEILDKQSEKNALISPGVLNGFELKQGSWGRGVACMSDQACFEEYDALRPTIVNALQLGSIPSKQAYFRAIF